MGDDGDRGSRLGFSLPPIRLPRVLFPEGLRFRVPGWAAGRGSGLLAAIALDVADIVVILTVGDSLLRPFIGTAVMAVVLGPIGLVYAAEFLPTVAGLPVLAATPTATILTYARRRANE